ncbi:MAG: tetratricopeptide repeat protein [Planctomycetes bacterium]|nr:tetratricopeptide repeat protein [Planctomycetota bacterium]
MSPLFHVGHGLVAAGVGYIAAFSATAYSHTAPGSPEHIFWLATSASLIIFEAAFIVYVVARRRRMKRLWKDAEALTRAHQYDAARANLLQLTNYMEYRLKPERVFLSLGALAEAQEDWREAALCYRRCGDYPPALLNLGVLMLLRGANDRAAEALRKFSARVPEDTSSAIMLAMALYRSGKIDAALSTLRSRLARRPSSPLLKKNVERLERGEEPALTI